LARSLKAVRRQNDVKRGWDVLKKAEGVERLSTRYLRGRLIAVRRHDNVKQGWDGLNEARVVERSQWWRNRDSRGRRKPFDAITTSNGDGTGKRSGGVEGSLTAYLRRRLKAVRCHNDVKRGWGELNKPARVQRSRWGHSDMAPTLQLLSVLQRLFVGGVTHQVPKPPSRTH
jgi:hypothetical protein